MKLEDKAVVQQALEALEIGWSPTYTGVDAREKGMEAITALRQLLEQPEPMPLTPHQICEMGLVHGMSNLERYYYEQGVLDAEFHHGITTPPAQPADHSEQHLDMVDHGDELTIAYLDGVHTGKQIARREWVGLTDEEREALILEPDGSAEANVKRVEVLPGAWGKEYNEVDAWSKALILQMLSDHEAKLREKNGGAA